jgi:hypothetical protein
MTFALAAARARKGGFSSIDVAFSAPTVWQTNFVRTPRALSSKPFRHVLLWPNKLVRLNVTNYSSLEPVL